MSMTVFINDLLCKKTNQILAKHWVFQDWIKYLRMWYINYIYIYI